MTANQLSTASGARPEKLILQHIIMPQKNDKRQLLFIREKVQRGIGGCWNELSFDTYFNTFVWRKWKKYTIIEDLWAGMEASGQFTLEIASLDGNANETILHQSTHDFPEKTLIERQISVPEDCCLIFFRFKFQNDSRFVFSGGHFFSRKGPASLINALAVICTFKRENYLRKNIMAIGSARERDPVLRNHLKMLVIDNASNLDIEEFAALGAEVVHNPNTGGSGGYARGMLEAQKKPDIQYAILMDDDIELEPETIYRSILFLSFLKIEYSSHFLGGAMFSILNRKEQRFWLERLSRSTLTFRHLLAFMDMTKIENCITSSIHDELPCSYNAWWYCCIPMKVIRRNGLPLPFFVKYDDVEYGARNNFKGMMMNGICVWHEDFEIKESKTTRFFEERNRFFFMLFDCPSFLLHLRFVTGMSFRAFRKALKYDYGLLGVYSEVYRSLRKGVGGLEKNGHTPEFLKSLKSHDVEKDKTPQVYNDNLLYIKSQEPPKDRLASVRKLFSLLTFSGHLLPARFSTRWVSGVEEPPLARMFLAKKIVILHENEGSVEVRRIDPAKFWKNVFVYSYQAFLTILAYPRLKREFGPAHKKFTGKEFWQKYLGLDGTHE